jgi:uncharacterized protein
MMMQPELMHILAQTTLFTDGKVYLILKIALPQETCSAPVSQQSPAPFWACMRDKDETTLVLPQDAFGQLPPSVTVLGVSPPYRLLTCDIPLDWNVTGYLAALAAVLADAGISIFTLSAFSRDHIFVAAVDFDRAWDILDTFIRTCRDQAAHLVTSEVFV